MVRVPSAILWSGKPYIRKTIVKAIIIYALLTLLFSWLFILVPLLFVIYTILAWSFIAFYIYWKRAHTYYVKENSILITRSWVFGTYRRELTFDRLHDVHVQQGLLARLFKCGSVVFVTTAGLEVGYVGAGGGGRVYRSGIIFGGGAIPIILRGAWNSFLDVRFPEHASELIAKKLVEWREAFQQRRIATTVERLAEKTVAIGTSIAEELAKLKDLLDKGAITKEEFEKAKKKLLGE